MAMGDPIGRLDLRVKPSVTFRRDFSAIVSAIGEGRVAAASPSSSRQILDALLRVDEIIRACDAVDADCSISIEDYQLAIQYAFEKENGPLVTQLMQSLSPEQKYLVLSTPLHDEPLIHDLVVGEQLSMMACLFDGLSSEEKTRLLSITANQSNLVHIAVQYQNTDLLRLLFLGLEPAHKQRLLLAGDDSGCSPVYFAIELADLDSVNLCFEGLSPDQKFQLLLVRDEDDESVFLSVLNCKDFNMLTTCFFGLSSDQRYQLFILKDRSGLEVFCTLIQSEESGVVADLVSELSDGHRQLLMASIAPAFPPVVLKISDEVLTALLKGLDKGTMLRLLSTIDSDGRSVFQYLFMKDRLDLLLSQLSPADRDSILREKKEEVVAVYQKRFFHILNRMRPDGIDPFGGSTLEVGPQWILSGLRDFLSFKLVEDARFVSAGFHGVLVDLINVFEAGGVVSDGGATVDCLWADMQLDKPGLLMGGSRTHGISFVLSKGKLLICNRGSGRFVLGGKVDSVVELNAPKSKAELKEIMSLLAQAKKEPSEKSFEMIYGLRDRLGEPDPSEELFSGFSQAKQRARNCYFLSPLTALYATMILLVKSHAIEEAPGVEMPDAEARYLSGLDEARIIGRAFYKEFRLFQKQHAREEYEKSMAELDRLG